jgi:hypothetical protein
MKKRSTVSFFLFVLFSALLVSCLEELEDTDKLADITFEPSVDFPLVNSNFTMQEFITEGKSKARIVEQGGMMVLIYDDSLVTPPGDQFFILPDQQSPVLSITGPEFSFPSPGATVTITKTLNFSFNTTGTEQLDSVLIKAGQMLFEVTSTFPANINLTIDIAAIRTQGGSAVQQNFSFTGPGNQNPSVNLANAVIDLTDNGTTTNTITFSITAEITDTGQPLNNTHQLDCSFGMDNIQFRALFGEMGTLAFPMEADSINVDVFNSTFNGDVTLSSPSIRLTMRNSFGLPVGFDINSVQAIKLNSPVIALSGAAVSAPLNPYLLDAPDYLQIGQTIDSEIEITSSNSNLAQLISSLPRYLAYQFDLSLNPPPITAKNFVLDTSRLTIGVHVELPFHGSFSELSLSKRFDFDGIGIDDLGRSKIKLKTINETPLDMRVQAYFVDANEVVLDSLFIDRTIVKGAPVDANGFTQSANEVEMEVPITQAKVDRIDQATHVMLVATMITVNNGTVPVKISSTDKLQVILGVNTRVKYNLK